MSTLDKIKYHVHAQIIDTINLCANKQEVEILNKWLIDCKAEISRRETAKENTYPLYYELEYLKMVIGR